MASYHIHPETGDPGLCRSLLGRCPFSEGPDSHYDSPQAAREAYEAQWENMFPPTTLTDDEALDIVYGDDVEAKVKLANGRAFEDLHIGVTERLRHDPDPRVQAAMDDRDKYFEDMEKELKESGVDEFIEGRFHTMAGEAAQKRFRDSVKQQIELLGYHMEIGMRDSLLSPKVNAWANVSKKLKSVDTESTEAMLEVAKEIETQRNNLAQLHSEADLTSRRGRKQASQYEKLVAAMDEALGKIRFDAIDDPDVNDIAGAQYRWLSAMPFNKEPKYEVPCDDGHSLRVTRDGYCRKCGGAE